MGGGGGCQGGSGRSELTPRRSALLRHSFVRLSVDLAMWSSSLPHDSAWGWEGGSFPFLMKRERKWRASRSNGRTRRKTGKGVGQTAAAPGTDGGLRQG